MVLKDIRENEFSLGGKLFLNGLNGCLLMFLISINNKIIVVVEVLIFGAYIRLLEDFEKLDPSIGSWD